MMNIKPLSSKNPIPKKINVLLLPCRSLRLPDDDADYSGIIDEERLARIRRVRVDGEKRRLLASGLLIYEIARRHSIPAKIERGENGRPYFTTSTEQTADIRFNVTHSGDLAAAVYAEADMGSDITPGIDIEQIRKAPDGVAGRFFSADEAAAVDDAADSGDGISERDRVFFGIWTKKESCVKAAGCGITVPMNSFSVMSGKCRVVLGDGRAVSCTVRKLDVRADGVDGEYAAAAAIAGCDSFDGAEIEIETIKMPSW